MIRLLSMCSFKQFYDISVFIKPDLVQYENDIRFNLLQQEISFNNDIITTSSIKMSCHTGSHIDTPYHFIKQGNKIENFPINHFILPAIVFNIRDSSSITLTEIQNLKITPGCALLFKTINSKRRLVLNPDLQQDYVYLSEDAADFCVKKKLNLVGIDYLSIDKSDNPNYPVHIKLLKHNILILETIDLIDVPEGKFTLICLPLKIKNTEASPVRAILVK
jgi:arylformamidase